MLNVSAVDIPHSVESENVLRELSLASEKRKRVLPVDLEVVILPSSFEYPLAGLQRVPIADFDRIVHSHKHGVEKIIKKDVRKSLMILPFEDLSPTGDNAWFADGIASELISALSNVKSIRIADNQATKEFKKYSGQLATYAREMDFRYFVQGDVRKFGDNIKITARLLDIETGDHLWQESLKGTMENIFDFQEEVALKVVAGLKVHLASDEKKKLAERGTENTEAYELYLKAVEYYARQTRDGYRIAIDLVTHALKLDSNYVSALRMKANVLTELYRKYDRNPKHLEESESLAKRALEIKPDFWSAYHALSNCYRLHGNLVEAEEAVQEYVRRAPEDPHSHFALGIFYANTNQPAKAIPHYEKSLELRPGYLITYWNLVLVSDQAHDQEHVKKWSLAALPLYQRRLSLVPDDENARVCFASLLLLANQPDQALLALEPLLKKQDLDAISCYNITCLYARLGDAANAFTMLRRSVGAGFSGVEVFRRDPDLAPLRGMAEFEVLLKQLEITN